MCTTHATEKERETDPPTDGEDDVRTQGVAAERDTPTVPPSNHPLREREIDIRDDPFRDDPLEREIAPLDFSPSSTATDPSDAKQDLTTSYAIGRFNYTDNATYIGEDLPASSELGQTLNQINRDTRDDDDDHVESARRQADLRREVQMWGTQIELTDAEIRVAESIVMSVPAGARRNFGLDVVVLGALTVAANQVTGAPHTSKSIRLRGPETGNTELVEQYESLRDDVGVTADAVSRFRRWYDQHDL